MEFQPVRIEQINPLVQEGQLRAKSLFNNLSRLNYSNQGTSTTQTQPQTGFGDTPYQDNFSDLGYGDNVPRSLIHTESGGNFQASNDAVGSSGRAGHFGQLQFGHDRLDDARRAGVIPLTMTADQFLNDREAQVRVGNWHFNDIDQRIASEGLDRYFGQTVGGVRMSPNAMRAMAHLGGFGGLTQFLSTGGRHNPADINNTSLQDYGRLHG